MSSKQKFYLDTSVFIELLLKTPQVEFDDKIGTYCNGRRFAAYYTVIELNRGLIKVLVDHHKNVLELKSTSAAYKRLSNAFGRTSNYGNIVTSYLLDKEGQMSNDYRQYAISLENMILDFCERAIELVGRFVGHFSSHPLATISLYSSEDYPAYLDKCKREASVDVVAFLEDFDFILYRLREDLLSTAGKLKVDHHELMIFLEEALGGAIETDARGQYKHLSDFIIALESPDFATLVANDHIFDLFMPMLRKRGGYASGLGS